MKLFFYPKLAVTGIRKNRKLYTPYILTCAGMVMMHYIITALSCGKSLRLMPGSGTLGFMLNLGSWVIALFSVLFLFYTNSFLLRRRKKEFGLYNILGMDKWNIGRVLLWETVIIAAVAIVCGLAAGMLFSKFAELLLFNMMNVPVTYDLEFPVSAILTTAAVFGATFLLILLRGLLSVRLSNPIELIHGESAGEKPPKANWVIGVLGFIILAAAYALAVSIKEPLGALMWFFVAVIMVIIATYAIFIAGSVLVCRVMQKNKGYYYKPNHFVSVSSMAYRMKRNGAGLASICILATMVLVMISSTSCLYFGAEDALHTRYPNSVTVGVRLSCDAFTDGVTKNEMRSDVMKLLEKNLTDYRVFERNSVSLTGIAEGSRVNTNSSDYQNDLLVYEKMRDFSIMPIEDYNALTGENVTLESGEALIYTVRCSYDEPYISFSDELNFKIVGEADKFNESGGAAMLTVPTVFVFIPDYDSNISLLDEVGQNVNGGLWELGFDSSDVEEKIIKTKNEIYDTISKRTEADDAAGKYRSLYVEALSENSDDFYSANAGLFFLGIMLSIVFLIATVLIIYYKQISEGYEDQSRFEIMQKVGMTKKNIRRSINSQMLTVFLAPMLVAITHFAFAFPMIFKLLMLFNLYNMKLFILTSSVSALVFTVFYAVVYKITSNSYYSLVSGENK